MTKHRRIVAIAALFMFVAVAFAGPASADTVEVNKPSNITARFVSHNVPLNTYRTMIWDGCRQDIRIGNFNTGYAGMKYKDGTCNVGGVQSYTTGSGGLRSNPVFSNRMCSAGSGSAPYCIQLSDGALWQQYPDGSGIVQGVFIICGAHPTQNGCAEYDVDPFPG